MINIVFFIGLISLSTGLYLAYGLAVMLIISGTLFLTLALVALLRPKKITVVSHKA